MDGISEHIVSQYLTVVEVLARSYDLSLDEIGAYIHP